MSEINVGNGITGPQLHQQLQLEQWMSTTGGARATEGNWEKGAEGFLVDRFSALYIQKCIELWKIAKKKAVFGGAMWNLLSTEEAVAQVSGEALTLVLSGNNHGVSRNTLAHSIGSRAEFVLWMMHPKLRGSLLIRHLRLISGRNLSMKLIIKRLTDAGFKKAAHYKPLKRIEKVALGTLLLENVRATTGLIDWEVKINSKKHRMFMCKMTDNYWKFLQNWKHNLQTFRHVWMPMTAPPRPWSKIDDGGYYVIGSTCSTVDWELWDKQMRHATGAVLKSLNYPQSIAFRCDHDQFDLLRHCWQLGHAIGSMVSRERVERPLDHEYKLKGLGPTAYWQAQYKYLADRRLDGQRTAMIHAFAAYERLKQFEKIYFVYYHEPRGRLLQRGSQLNYQSNKLVRSALTFDRAAPIKGNEREFAWALGDAGFTKTNDMDGRLLEMLENPVPIIRTGEDPMEYVGYWENAKDPFRFVALCREFARYVRDDSYQTRHVFQLDQCTSCYGHAAALLRDENLAAATNLIGTECADLYATFLEAVRYGLHRSVAHEDSEHAKWWLESGLLDRKLIKDAVMPIIYGRSYQTLMQIMMIAVRDSLNNWLTTEGLKAYDLAKTMADTVQYYSHDILPGIGKLSQWLRDCARISIKNKRPPYWVTPTGWTVLSYAQQWTTEDTVLEVSGRRMRISCGNEDGPINTRKTYSRLCADYIHSMDAAFLQKFIDHWSCYDYPIVTVHDCLGTSLDKVSLLREELLDQFNRFYQTDWLNQMKSRIEKETGHRVPEPPIVGTLAPDRIGENRHLFT